MGFQQLFHPPSPRAQGLRAELINSLRLVDRAQWEQVSRSCGLFLSFPFLLSIEESEATPCSYVLLRDADGVLVAGMPTYHWDGSPDPGLDHYEPFAAGARWFLGRRARPEPWLPTFLAGTRAGYATEFAVDPGYDHWKTQVVGRLLQEAARLAESAKASSMGVMWLTSAAARQVAHCLSRPQYLFLPGPSCTIEVIWDSFDGYLTHLSTSRRHSAVREQERFHRSGLRVEFTDLQSCVEEIAPLASRVQEKYGHALSAQAVADQLEAQARHLNSASRVIVCRRGDRLVGFSLLYSWAGTLYGRLVGFDYAATAGSDAYFSLAFYLPIQLAIDERLRHLKLGMASWKPKVLRGASLDPAWTLACPPVTVRGAWTRVARAQGDDPSRWWAMQFPGQVDWEHDWRWTRSGLAGESLATGSSK